MIKKHKPKIDPHSVSQKLELNYCPRCGHALEDAFVFGRERRVCPSCGLVVFREHKVAAVVLVQDAEGRVLLTRRVWEPQQGQWSLPGGYVDHDEPPREAAVRECKEETDLDIENLELLTLVSEHGEGQPDHQHGADLVIVYRARVAGGVLTPADDAAEARFFPLHDLPTLAFRSTREAVANLSPREEAGS
jgi:ADP-ribose pyrophosphatase YjhB (NUDIX family)